MEDFIYTPPIIIKMSVFKIPNPLENYHLYFLKVYLIIMWLLHVFYSDSGGPIQLQKQKRAQNDFYA